MAMGCQGLGLGSLIPPSLVLHPLPSPWYPLLGTAGCELEPCPKRGQGCVWDDPLLVRLETSLPGHLCLGGPKWLWGSHQLCPVPAPREGPRGWMEREGMGWVGGLRRCSVRGSGCTGGFWLCWGWERVP